MIPSRDLQERRKTVDHPWVSPCLHRASPCLHPAFGHSVRTNTQLISGELHTIFEIPHDIPVNLHEVPFSLLGLFYSRDKLMKPLPFRRSSMVKHWPAKQFRDVRKLVLNTTNTKLPCSRCQWSNCRGPIW